MTKQASRLRLVCVATTEIAALLIHLTCKANSLTPHASREIAAAVLENDAKSMRVTYRTGPDTVVKIQHQQEAFDTPTISEDRRSVGWTILWHVDASYLEPGDLDIYRDGQVMPAPSRCGRCCQDSGGGMPWNWHFLDGGKQVVVSYSFSHGQPNEHRQLQDVTTGECLGYVPIDNDTGKPPRQAPAWAKD